jgi:hypothetical protein
MLALMLGRGKGWNGGGGGTGVERGWSGGGYRATRRLREETGGGRGSSLAEKLTEPYIPLTLSFPPPFVRAAGKGRKIYRCFSPLRRIEPP